jgi:DNA-binding NarL/FixJ family response regulator
MEELTSLEKKIVVLVAQGGSNHEVADALGLGAQTVRNYLHVIYEKLDLHNRAQLTSYAWSMGWMDKPADET